MRVFNNFFWPTILLVLIKGMLLAGDRELVLLTGIHTKVFSRENLFEKENKEISKWSDLLEHLKTFVDQNSAHNERLMNAFDLCNQVSLHLTSVLQLGYSSVFADTKTPTKRTVDNVRKSIKKLKKEKMNLTHMETDLKNTHYFFTKKKEVKEVLLRLFLTLDLTIDKLNNDFEKQKKQRSQERKQRSQKRKNRLFASLLN
jgi:hypothetical protein